MVLRARVRFQANDIWDTPEDGNRYEVIDGALYMTPPPLYGHQYASTSLAALIWSHVRQHGLGQIVTAPVGVVLDDENGVQPDLVFVSRDRLHIITERGVEGAPDLVIEILSRRTQSRDRGVKMKRYAAAGIPHYWIVVPRTQSIEAYRLAETGYELTGTYGPGSTFRPEIFPGLEISVDLLWE
ncbi:MAG: Uma2 family endonuclease [Dehalococcoidia bacterium]